MHTLEYAMSDVASIEFSPDWKRVVSVPCDWYGDAVDSFDIWPFSRYPDTVDLKARGRLILQGTSLIRNTPPVGPYNSPMPGDLW